MDYSFFIFLSSGLFLGWSLGANDAANIFGTAVGTKMVRFHTAAVIASVFVMLGAVFSGGGASTTLVELGAVNAIAGSFMCACAAALTVYWMVNSGIPVSTSQSIVGAIIGYTEVLPAENVLQTAFKKLGAKRPELNPVNEAAFNRGFEIGKAAREAE